LITEVYSEHRYLLEANELTDEDKKLYRQIMAREALKSDYEKSIRKLSDYLYKHFNEKAVILIDEYDIPIQQGYSNIIKIAVVFDGKNINLKFEKNF